MISLFWARGGCPQASEFAEYACFPAPCAKLFVMAPLGYLFLVPWSVFTCPSCNEGSQKDTQSDEDNFSKGMLWKLK